MHAKHATPFLELVHMSTQLTHWGHPFHLNYSLVMDENYHICSSKLVLSHFCTIGLTLYICFGSVIPAGWECMPSGTCYRVSMNPYTWTYSNSYDCWYYYQGRLAVVDTQAKHDFLDSKGLIGNGKYVGTYITITAIVIMFYLIILKSILWQVTL